MAFFKAIKDNKVYTVGCVFLKWNTKMQRFFVCDVDEGQFVESYDEQHVIRDEWMKVAPDGAGEHEDAKVVIISLQEYEDLLAILNEGEEVVYSAPEIEKQEEIPEEPEEEKPMTIAEMRELILKQQEQINSLIEKVSE